MGIDMIINFLDDSITRGAGAARPGEEYVDALNEIVMKNGRATAVRTQNGEIPCGTVILAIGHSARDT